MGTHKQFAIESKCEQSDLKVLLKIALAEYFHSLVNMIFFNSVLRPFQDYFSSYEMD